MFAKVFTLIQLINKTIDKGELFMRDLDEAGIRIAFIYKGVVVSARDFPEVDDAIEFLNNTGNDTADGLVFRFGNR